MALIAVAAADERQRPLRFRRVMQNVSTSTPAQMSTLFTGVGCLWFMGF